MEFISHCIKRNPHKLEGRATAGMLIIFLVLSLVGWIYLTQASHVATTSRHNQELEAEKARLERENMELLVEIAKYESVGRLAARARELGFESAFPGETDFVAVVVPDSGVPSGMQSGAEDNLAQEPAPDRWPDADPRAESSWARITLGGVKAQFIAWARTAAQ
jgi:hypothetical protein